MDDFLVIFKSHSDQWITFKKVVRWLEMIWYCIQINFISFTFENWRSLRFRKWRAHWRTPNIISRYIFLDQTIFIQSEFSWKFFFCQQVLIVLWPFACAPFAELKVVCFLNSTLCKEEPTWFSWRSLSYDKIFLKHNVWILEFINHRRSWTHGRFFGHFQKS